VVEVRAGEALPALRQLAQRAYHNGKRADNQIALHRVYLLLMFI
jgi:hypothetical protein